VGKTASARQSGTAGWFLGISVVMAGAIACSGANTPSSADQVVVGGPVAGASAGPVAGGPAPAGAGSTPPIPGMSAMSANNGSQGPGMQQPTAGSGASMGGAGVSGGAAGAAGSAGGAAQAGAGGNAGVSGAAASAGSAGGAAGSGSTPSMTGATAVCMGGKVGMDSLTASTGNITTEYAAVKYLARSNAITSMKTTLLVPKKPTAMQVLFIWPGLQCNNAQDPARIGNGILQPVLTWGPSCAPKLPSSFYSSWWISGMYVNVSTAAAGPSGCAGGDFISTEVGDLLQMDISVKGTAWTQTILDLSTMKSVDFTIDLKGQEQNWATWAIEIPAGETIMFTDQVVYTDSVLTFKSPVTSCQPSERGPNDSFTAPVLSTDGLSCCYDKIILHKAMM
jgi:hypothetical protein